MGNCVGENHLTAGCTLEKKKVGGKDKGGKEGGREGGSKLKKWEEMGMGGLCG